MSDWQPIETAPTNESVLVCGGGVEYPIVAYWSGLPDEPWLVDGYKCDAGDIDWPTHWQPLPPPKGEG